MSKLLIVGQTKELRNSYRTMLRGTGLKSIFTEDIIDGMKELSWFEAALIIWEIQPRILREMKSLSLLHTKYHRIPLLLVVDNHDFTDVLGNFADDVILKEDIDTEFIGKVTTLTGSKENTALESY